MKTGYSDAALVRATVSSDGRIRFGSTQEVPLFGSAPGGANDCEVPLLGMSSVEIFRLKVTGFTYAWTHGAMAERTAELYARLGANERSELANRALNLVIAVVALVLLAPLMLLVGLAVRLTSRGPVFYTQTRVGLDRRRRPDAAESDRRRQDVGGCAFRMIKFRSMRVDAEQGTGAVWAQQNDPRVTPIGRHLRKTRLDELPQLINVIVGDMNVVGPRPERPSIFAELRKEISVYPLRQRARPGITGLAQINHAYDASLEDVRTKVNYDMEYLKRQSVLEDLRIMLYTLPVMLFRRGAN